MSLPDRLERVGIVVGCSFMIALPTSALLGSFLDVLVLPWQFSLVSLLPGIPVGLVAVSESRLTYSHVWRFAIVNWLSALLLWEAFDVAEGGTDLPLALACWTVAVAVGVAAATVETWIPRIRF